MPDLDNMWFESDIDELVHLTDADGVYIDMLDRGFYQAAEYIEANYFT